MHEETYDINSIPSNHPTYRDRALQGLYQVDDPEIGLNIVDLGLIYGLYFDEQNQNLKCEMTLTTPFCPMGESITQHAQWMLNQQFPGWSAEIQLCFEPPWNPDRISENGKKFLGRY